MINQYNIETIKHKEQKYKCTIRDDLFLEDCYFNLTENKINILFQETSGFKKYAIYKILGII